MLDSIDYMFFAVVGIGTYVYMAFALRNMPDPSTEFGMSLNAMIIGMIAASAFGIALASRILLGYGGYILTAVVVPPLIHKIVKKMTASNKTSATIFE